MSKRATERMQMNIWIFCRWHNFDGRISFSIFNSMHWHMIIIYYILKRGKEIFLHLFLLVHILRSILEYGRKLFEISTKKKIHVFQRNVILFILCGKKSKKMNKLWFVQPGEPRLLLFSLFRFECGIFWVISFRSY